MSWRIISQLRISSTPYSKNNYVLDLNLTSRHLSSGILFLYPTLSVPIRESLNSPATQLSLHQIEERCPGLNGSKVWRNICDRCCRRTKDPRQRSDLFLDIAFAAFNFTPTFFFNRLLIHMNVHLWTYSCAVKQHYMLIPGCPRWPKHSSSYRSPQPVLALVSVFCLCPCLCCTLRYAAIHCYRWYALQSIATRCWTLLCAILVAIHCYTLLYSGMPYGAIHCYTLFSVAIRCFTLTCAAKRCYVGAIHC